MEKGTNDRNEVVRGLFHSKRLDRREKQKLGERREPSLSPPYQPRCFSSSPLFVALVAGAWILFVASATIWTAGMVELAELSDTGDSRLEHSANRRSNFHFHSDHCLYNFTLDNSNFFLSPLKVRIIGSQL